MASAGTKLITLTIWRLPSAFSRTERRPTRRDLICKRGESSMLKYLWDPANAITITGLLFSSASLFLALSDRLELSVAAALWLCYRTTSTGLWQVARKVAIQM